MRNQDVCILLLVVEAVSARMGFESLRCCNCFNLIAKLHLPPINRYKTEFHSNEMLSAIILKVGTCTLAFPEPLLHPTKSNNGHIPK